MIPELGHFALVLALALALVQGILPLAGAQRRDVPWMTLAVPAARAQFACVAIAFGCLTWSFVARDFSVLYVATNSNSQLPLAYRIAAVWGAHEGSLLLWTLILGGWTVAVSIYVRSMPLAFSARVIAVMGLVSIGFLLFMLATSNPFERLLPAAAEGRDLNPLLQDPGLVVHPPMLYMGYVGTVVPFAFAIAALLDGRLDLTWSRWTRPWTLVAWVFLTLGITLGSWWAYYELGWGGWWFWDPVENASFMPWLVTTALLHSLAVTEKRGAFKAWTVILAIFAFSLSLLGTFLVRSGVLVSVHAFATDPARGVFILIFLGLVVGSALLLYAWRAANVASSGTFALVSRESLLLVNNVLLVVAAGSVLLGTLYPLILDSLGLGKVSVGPPYFNTVFVPLMLPLAVLLGIGPIARWKRAAPASLLTELRMAMATTLILTVALAVLAAGSLPVMALAGLATAVWVAWTSVQAFAGQWRKYGSAARAVANIPRGFHGMTLAHFGVALFIVGVTCTSVWSADKDIRMAPGERYTLADYTFELVGVSTRQGPNFTAERGEVRVSRDEQPLTTLYPEKRQYGSSGQPMTEAGIDA
ncbi:MAG: heme lyase CcmF/NrfE family subunit, partial [Gammaproteobacteria bacterium]|nr:heme lyase CcmF/NrfE family subunit [Gammaproteobacteria bacterium]